MSPGGRPRMPAPGPGATETELDRHRRRESMRKARARAEAAGLCRLCLEAKPPEGQRTCEACLEYEGMKRRFRRERAPLVERFELALNLVRRGYAPRDALGRAGILGPLQRGEI